jgi:hypothetical protein
VAGGKLSRSGGRAAGSDEGDRRESNRDRRQRGRHVASTE